jgi:hypothetical protein
VDISGVVEETGEVHRGSVHYSGIASLGSVAVGEAYCGANVFGSVRALAERGGVEVFLEELEHPPADEGGRRGVSVLHDFSADAGRSLCPSDDERHVLRDDEDGPEVLGIQGGDEGVVWCEGGLGGQLFGAEGSEYGRLTVLGGAADSHFAVAGVYSQVYNLACAFWVEICDSLGEVVRSMGVGEVIGIENELGGVGGNDEMKGYFFGVRGM